ncbi:polysaccharide lyase family 8 super-sandwich domain-containing protein [Microbacterium sp. SSW1-59]|uniref:polysaccharide lyase family 8 super-sandwich domain-containing protein n=1 Tax=Microbacterium xanthum TaxID=3079794 RepID=UPI002AD41169|nr:polysaccharide lyase family 8 super-sandwich domain-containing protein [Microbacterium sp. SSW1-59]MDZ8201188.1 polysaccharide lyase family 8 super-sandwich domain-containing protein [Microbacterium sp. SSW1-59]
MTMPLFLRLRRTAAVLVAFALAGALLLAPSPPAHAADEFAQLRETWRALLVGPRDLDASIPAVAEKIAANDEVAREWYAQMDTSPDRTFVWPDLVAAEVEDDRSRSAQITTHYTRLLEMTTAYATNGSSLAGDTAYRDALLGALDWVEENLYNTTVEKYGNWWDWEIGAPLRLNEITVMLYDELTADQVGAYMAAVDRFSPEVKNTGANRIWKAHAVAGHGILTGTPEKLMNARDGLSDVLAYAETGDGFHRDGSFIQHQAYAYAGGYGVQLILALSDLLVLLQNSSWPVTDPNIENIVPWVEDTFDPMIYRGAVMDAFRGRNIAREYTEDHVSGHQAIAAILRLSGSVDDEAAASFRSAAKQWILSDTYRDFVEHASISSIAEATALLADESVPEREEVLATYQFPRTDRAVHKREGWAMALSMYSERIKSYESINGEHLHGWHTADGMVSLYTSDLDQYSEGYWATVDPYRLPGTTVDTREREDRSGTGKLSPASWVGGTAVGGEFGATGMHLFGWESSLEARKSWFMLDEEVVALGADISASDGRAIETIVENRKLSDAGDDAITIDGEAMPTTADWSDTLEGVQTVHVATGEDADGGVGYYFPEEVTLNAARDLREGSWVDINDRPVTPTDVLDDTYGTFWLDHGVDPDRADYAYVMLPASTQDEVAAYAADSGVEILANTAQVQAVEDSGLGLVAANVWTDEPTEVGPLTVTGQSSVMVWDSPEGLRLSVSDPTHAEDGVVTVELDRASAGLVSAAEGMRVTQLSPTIQVEVDVAGSRGATFEALFGAPPAPGTLSSTSGHSGLRDGNHSVSWNLWWGSNASEVTIYENGEPVHTERLTVDGNASQTVSVDLTGRVNGTYEYTAEVVNGQGSAHPKPLTVKVTDAEPGTPKLSSDNWDKDGAYTVTADMWWGTNATSWRLLEDGVEIATGDLAAATPAAQRVRVPVEGRTAGTYAYVMEFTNHAGTTSSKTHKVTVR